MAEIGESHQPLIDKLHGKAQKEDWVDKTVTRRSILKAAPFIAAGLAGYPAVRHIKNHKSEMPSKKEVKNSPQTNETFRIVLSPEQMELGQMDGNFDALRTYTDAPFLSYDATKNEGHVTNVPEVMTIEMTSYNNNIVFRKGPTLKDEGSIILTKGSEKYDKIYKSHVAAVRLLGPGYGDSNSPGRPILPPGEEGGAWFALVGAEKDQENNINYYYADLEGNKLPLGEAPLCFSATFGNRINPS